MVFTTDTRQMHTPTRWLAQVSFFIVLFFASGQLCASGSSSQFSTTDPLTKSIIQFLNLPTEVTFRDITPSHAASDIRHLQQTFLGVDVDQAIIAVTVKHLKRFN